MGKWNITDKTDYVLSMEVKSINPEYKDWEISMKWDGCVHLVRKWYGNKVDDDYIHICDLPQFIKLMQEALEKARDHYHDSSYLKESYGQPEQYD